MAQISKRSTAKWVRVTGIVVFGVAFCALAVGAAYVNSIWPHTQPRRSPAETHIGLVATSPQIQRGAPTTGFENATFAVDSPSLDLLPTNDGWLRGWMRVSLLAIDQSEYGARIGLSLPRQAIVEVGDAQGAVLSFRDGRPDDWKGVSCAADEYVDLGGVIAPEELADDARSALTGEKWTFQCYGDRMIAWYWMAESRKFGETVGTIGDATLATYGIAWAWFAIPEYSGISRTAFDRLSLNLEVASRSHAEGVVPLADALPEESSTGTSVSMLEASGRRFVNLTPGDYSFVDSPNYGAGQSPRWRQEFSSESAYFGVEYELTAERRIGIAVTWLFVTVAALAVGRVCTLAWQKAVRPSEPPAAGLSTKRVRGASRPRASIARRPNQRSRTRGRR